MALPRLHGVEELLDSPVHEPQVLAQSLDHVASVNRWLGGRRALRLAVAPRVSAGARILDVGTGSGDLPAALAHLPVRITATDAHPQMAAIAARRLARHRNVHVQVADARALPYRDDTFDLALFAMMLHHLDDDAAVAALREGARVAGTVVVSELHRTRANYLGARLLAHTLWAGNPLTRHDGPMSVLRAYVPGELATLARRAGLRVVELRRRWFYRVVLVATRT